MNETQRDKQDIVAQWSFDTRPILGRFHLWLEDVEAEWVQGEPAREFTRDVSFLDGRMERLFAMTGAVTAIGTQVFGGPGAGAALDKNGLNQVKKDADAMSAYAMSESLWYLSRQLPENHAIMVCLGEGLMPKAGETPEMGSNPQIGFGRVYARPEVARHLDRLVLRLLNDRGYGWEGFYGDIKTAGITVWGAAIDTLENTSRFAKGSPTGAMTILHLFDQPLQISRPYEGYVGMLVLPGEVVSRAADRSVLLDFRTPRGLVIEAIEATWPGIRRDHIHVWTLGGKSRAGRIGGLWTTWRDHGVHLVEDGWRLPGGMAAFTESGTYAPVYRVGTWVDEAGDRHLFLCDGYAASAEAVQAASIAPILGLDASMVTFTSRFDLPYDKEQDVMRLHPAAPDFGARLQALTGAPLDEAGIEAYRRMINEARDAGMVGDRPTITADYFFPEKRWEVLALSGYMGPDPYSGAPGVEQLGPGVYRATVRLVSRRGDKRVSLTLRLNESFEQSRLVFSPLLSRFLAGEPFETRPVKISDSGRIRNELQTLCAEALEFTGADRMRLHFDRIPPEVISPEKQKTLLKVLEWYKRRHPIWFSWVEMVLPGEAATV
ncbi:MAG TPA: hypothetical protein VK911_12585 [Vicinamibacterales bacterium]|nr:hypothetical protein [Vicinamibacterales bacterium]